MDSGGYPKAKRGVETNSPTFLGYARLKKNYLRVVLNTMKDIFHIYQLTKFEQNLFADFE